MRALGALLALLLVLAIPSEGLARPICLQDNFGDFLVLNGGKIDKKPYVVRFIVPGTCEIAASAVAVRVSDASIRLTIWQAGSPDGACITVFYSVATDDDFNGSGKYDGPPGGLQEGSVTLTRVDCSLVP